MVENVKCRKIIYESLQGIKSSINDINQEIGVSNIGVNQYINDMKRKLLKKPKWKPIHEE
jgi:hypothetical protein